MKDKRILYVGYGIVAILFYMAYSRNEKSKDYLRNQIKK
jgi:uncharacterized membrane protein